MARKQIQPGSNEVFCQNWQWKERGWSNEQDGFSLHISREALRRFVKGYWGGMPDIRPAPDEYRAPAGGPYGLWVDGDTYSGVIEYESVVFDSSYLWPDTEVNRWGL